MRAAVTAIALVAGLVLAAPPAAANGSAPTCRGMQATLVGTSGADRLVGSNRRDVVVGLGGNDRIEGRGGGDVICAGSGRDVVLAGAGSDIVLGGRGNDRLYGQRGKDELLGQRGADRLYGGPGWDRGFGGPGNDVVDGGGSGDRLKGDGGHDVLYGRGGNDRLFAGPGRDRLFGGPGHNDVLMVGDGEDHFDGGKGQRDQIAYEGEWPDEPMTRGVRVNLSRGTARTEHGLDTITGVEDVLGTFFRDVLIGDGRDNHLDARSGNDIVRGRGGNDELWGTKLFGGAGNDVLFGSHDSAVRLEGHSGRDVLLVHSNGKAQSVSGGAGNDRIHVTDKHCFAAACPHDALRISGGAGVDVVDVGNHFEYDWGKRPADHNHDYRLDLRTGVFTMPTHRILVRTVEGVIGTIGNDTIIGTNGPNTLVGVDGDDTIRGRGGADVLAGGSMPNYGGAKRDSGKDSLSGGRGADLCYSSAPPRGTGPADTLRCERVRTVPSHPAHDPERSG